MGVIEALKWSCSSALDTLSAGITSIGNGIQMLAETVIPVTGATYNGSQVYIDEEGIYYVETAKGVTDAVEIGDGKYYLEINYSGLDEALSGFWTRCADLINSIMPWVWVALAAVIVVWGVYIGVKIAIAHRNEDQVNARGMIKNLIIGVVVIAIIAVGGPLLINGLASWIG